MAKKLKKGAKEFFKDLEKLLDEIFGNGEKVADHALTPSKKRYKDKLKAKQERIERKRNGGKYNLENVDELGSLASTEEELLEWEKKIKILAFKEKGRFRLAAKNTPASQSLQL